MHACHNPSCGRPLPAHLVAHLSAWKALPFALRDAIWTNYRAGQEDDKKPTREYLEALDACIDWWRAHGTKCREMGTSITRERIHEIASRR